MHTSSYTNTTKLKMDNNNNRKLHTQQILTSCNGTVRTTQTTTVPNSPEFEFWMVRNPSSTPQTIISADELFVNGLLLPLNRLPHKETQQQQSDNQKKTNAKQEVKLPEPGSGPELSSSACIMAESTNSLLSASKRWKDIFKNKKNTTKDPKQDKDVKEKGRKKEKKNQMGASSAELNINIWPFSRSRSAGNNTTRPGLKSTTRKVSSAPCSRSNSAGESKSRKWPNSPGRVGVHVGRASPVWQVKRSGGIRSSESYAGKNGKAKALNLKVPMCIGHRGNLSCRSDESSGGSKGGGGGNLFDIRGLFSKKVY